MSDDFDNDPRLEDRDTIVIFEADIPKYSINAKGRLVLRGLRAKLGSRVRPESRGPAALPGMRKKGWGRVVNIASAHVATFGERARDVFYVTDLLGAQITAPTRQSAIKSSLLHLLSSEEQAAKPAA